MAGIKLEPPGPFNFAKPDEWPRWKRRFEQFRSASKLSAEGNPQQINTLLYCLGEEAESVLTSAGCEVGDDMPYATVMNALDAHFKVRRNVIFERARFNRRSQKDGESVEQYITELYSLVEFCEYGALKEEMLRDRLVVGISDLALSEKMQTDPTLTLESAKKMARQKKAAVKEQRRELQQEQQAALGRLRQSGSGKPGSKKPQGHKD